MNDFDDFNEGEGQDIMFMNVPSGNERSSSQAGSDKHFNKISPEEIVSLTTTLLRRRQGYYFVQQALSLGPLHQVLGSRENGGQNNSGKLGDERLILKGVGSQDTPSLRAETQLNISAKKVICQ